MKSNVYTKLTSSNLKSLYLSQHQIVSQGKILLQQNQVTISKCIKTFKNQSVKGDNLPLPHVTCYTSLHQINREDCI